MQCAICKAPHAPRRRLRGLRQHKIRKEAEDKLSELEEKPAALIETMGDVFVLDDTDMRIRDRGEIAVGPSGEFVRRVYRWPHMNIADLIRADVISLGKNGDEVLVDDSFKLALDILIAFLAQKEKEEIPSYSAGLT